MDQRALAAFDLAQKNNNQIGVSSSLPSWLQKSVFEVLKLHDDYVRQYGVNVAQPPYNAKSDANYFSAGNWWVDKAYTIKATDNYQAFQDAITYAFENNKPVYIPAGSFQVKKQLTIPFDVGAGFNGGRQNDFTIVGCGPKSKIRAYLQTGQYLFYAKSSDNTDRIWRFNLRDLYLSSWGYGNAFYAYQLNDLLVSNVFVDNFETGFNFYHPNTAEQYKFNNVQFTSNDLAIYMKQMHDPYMIGCMFEDNKKCISIDDVYNLILSACNFDDNTDSCIEAVNSKSIYIDGCLFENTYGTQYAAKFTNCAAINISGGAFRFSQAQGAYFENCTDVSIHTQFEGVMGIPIYIKNDNATVGKMFIINDCPIWKPNYFTTEKIYGIVIEGNVKESKITACAISDCETNAIKLVGNSGDTGAVPTGIDIMSNTIRRANRNASGSSVSVYLQGAKDCIVAGNNLEGGGQSTSGVYEDYNAGSTTVKADNNKIVNNFFKGFTTNVRQFPSNASVINPNY